MSISSAAVERMYRALCDMAREGADCPSIATVSALARCKTSFVWDGLLALEAQGRISIEQNPRAAERGKQKRMLSIAVPGVGVLGTSPDTTMAERYAARDEAVYRALWACTRAGGGSGRIPKRRAVADEANTNDGPMLDDAYARLSAAGRIVERAGTGPWVRWVLAGSGSVEDRTLLGVGVHPDTADAYVAEQRRRQQARRDGIELGPDRDLAPSVECYPEGFRYDDEPRAAAQSGFMPVPAYRFIKRPLAARRAA